MSGSFFAGAWQNHQMPQSVFNGPSGALPPADTSGYGNGLNAQADAKINYNSTLLGDLAPYAYGKPGRLSSQTAFLAIPHMLQKVVPVLSLPSSRWPCTEVTKLYHSVDDGDIAFTINIDRNSTKFAEGPQLFDKVGALRAIDPFCNLSTVNYLLAGIQMFADIPQCTAWTQFVRDIGMYDHTAQHRRIHTSWQILKLVRDIFIPFGVPRGSDMQGGQTQGMNNPNIYPVDHVTSMLMDGKCINLINLWRRHDISSGDDMILVLKKMVPNEYILSRQTNSYNRQTFSGLPNGHRVEGFGEVDLETRRQEGVWQLVPYIYDMKHTPENHTEYDFRENGYWHICKALQMFPADPRFEYDNYNDATKYRTTGELMEVSFQPLFIEGVPDGSSKGVIQKKPDYPIQMEQIGIAAPSSKLNLTGVGPATGAWKTYLKQKKRRRDADGDEWHIGDEHDAQRARRGARRGVFGNVAVMGTGMVDGNGQYTQDYIHPISNAAEESVDATGMADATGDEAYNDPDRVAEQGVQNAGAAGGAAAAAVGREIAGVNRLNEALSSIGSASNPSSASVGTSAGKKAPAKRGGRGGIAAAAAAAGTAAGTAAGATTMGLSGSYISNSGIASEQHASGSVRASLLSGTPPADDA